MNLVKENSSAPSRRALCLNESTISALQAEMDREESGRTIYWDFFSRDFRMVDGKLEGSPFGGGTVIPARVTIASRISHYVLQSPIRVAGSRFSHFCRFEKIIKALSKRKGFEYDFHVQRHVLTISLIRKYMNMEKMETPVVVIGDGRGTMSSVLLACLFGVKIVMVNIIKPLLYDLLWLRRIFSETPICLANSADEYQDVLSDRNIRLVAVRADDAQFLIRGPIGLAINMMSMQEMHPRTIASYFDVLRRSPNPKTAFYCCNTLEKTLEPDGITTRFDEYPWHPDDIILFDGVCPFLRYQYEFRIPFYKSFGQRQYRHRLTFLAKDHG